jgi:two-component system copper resistance phosphate regulon response regulator CusR
VGIRIPQAWDGSIPIVIDHMVTAAIPRATPRGGTVPEMRLLVAEDDAALLSVLARGLRQNGYLVDTAARGDDALHMLGVGEFAAAVLDWRMPGLDGAKVITEARRRGLHLPILMLTARDTLQDRVHGLDSGADDYLVKPFDFDELLARIRALLRRGGSDAGPVLRVAGLELDPATHDVRSAGRLVALTPREYAILEVLMRRAGAAVSRRSIAEQVWPDADASWNAMEAHMARLRAKLSGDSGVAIVAVRGTGYRLVSG